MTTSVSAVNNSATAALAAATTATHKTTLDQSDFLKLLVTQMQNQDPMNPMSDTEYVAQMASFTSLEQTKNMSATLTSVLALQQSTGYNSLLGKQVTISASDGSQASGIVDKVLTTDGVPYVQIGAKQYKAADVNSVANPVVASTNNSSSSSTTN